MTRLLTATFFIKPGKYASLAPHTNNDSMDGVVFFLTVVRYHPDFVRDGTPIDIPEHWGNLGARDVDHQFAFGQFGVGTMVCLLAFVVCSHEIPPGLMLTVDNSSVTGRKLEGDPIRRSPVLISL
jgi:hypothetical protein